MNETRWHFYNGGHPELIFGLTTYDRRRILQGSRVADEMNALEATVAAQAERIEEAVSALADGLDSTQAVTSDNPTDWYAMAQRRRQAMFEALTALRQVQPASGTNCQHPLWAVKEYLPNGSGIVLYCAAGCGKTQTYSDTESPN